MTDTREAGAIEGWLAYGAALNEGRALFPGDREFSAWMAEWQLAIQVEAHERAAAMWAAANADQLAEASPQQMHPAARKQEPRRSLLVQAPGAWAANGFGSNPHWLSSQGGGIEAAQEGVFRTKEPRCEGDRNRGGEIGAGMRNAPPSRSDTLPRRAQKASPRGGLSTLPRSGRPARGQTRKMGPNWRF